MIKPLEGDYFCHQAEKRGDLFFTEFDSEGSPLAYLAAFHPYLAVVIFLHDALG